VNDTARESMAGRGKACASAGAGKLRLGTSAVRRWPLVVGGHGFADDRDPMTDAVMTNDSRSGESAYF
jgi:hypothetical protein